jgi:hypothetical protein
MKLNGRAPVDVIRLSWGYEVDQVEAAACDGWAHAMLLGPIITPPPLPPAPLARLRPVDFLTHIRRQTFEMTPVNPEAL